MHHRKLQQSRPDVIELLPNIVEESLALAAPSLTEPDAKSINKYIRRQVAKPNSEGLLDAELDAMTAVCDQFPQGMYFNTLGVAQYRATQYEAAIESLNQSLVKSPTEQDLPGPHPSDLAMSHFQLDQTEQANRFRDQLNEAMKLDAWRDNEEAQQFVTEVNELFDTSEPTPENTTSTP
jgi:Flp pilus assembly protein TadD